MAHIFISYSRLDEVFARRLATSLSNMGADIWIDLEDIPAGMKWSSAIQHGLDTADLLIVIISPEAMASRNVEDEWQYYIDNNKPVIPILLRPAKIHFQLSRIQYIDFHRLDYELALRELYEELQRKGIRLSPNISAPSRAYQPVPHHYPQPSAVPNRKPFLVGAAVVAALALVSLLVIAVVIPALNRDNLGNAIPTTVAVMETLTDLVTQTPTTASTEVPITPTEIPITTATLAPLGFPGNPVTRNADWAPISQNFSGIDMQLVPAGCFTIGASQQQIDTAWAQCQAVLGQCNRLLFEDEQPQIEVCFGEPFWIGRVEVSNVRYGSSGSFPGDNVPRTNVTWQDARQFCESRGMRLPTEAEWEYAARGPDGLEYPWGNTFDGTRLNYCDASCQYDHRDNTFNDGYNTPAPVGSFPGGASWVGVLDLSGNVWEWTSTIYGFPYPYREDDGRENLLDTGSKRVLRGGSWNWISPDARTTARDDYAGQNASSDWYGFRCARDY